MKHLNLLIILILASTLWTEGAIAACNFPSKEIANQNAKRLTDEIKAEMLKGNVDKKVDQLTEHL